MNRACPFSSYNSIAKFPLRLFGRKRIHNRRPSRIDPFEDESSVLDSTIYEKLFRHIRLVRVHVDKPPRSQNSCGKQNGEFSFLSHVGTPAFWNEVQVGQAGKGSLLFLVPQVHEESYRCWPMSCVVIVRIGKYLEVSCHELAEEFDPIGQVLAPINDDSVPDFCLLFDFLSVTQPAHISEVRSNQVKLSFHLPRPRDKRGVS